MWSATAKHYISDDGTTYTQVTNIRSMTGGSNTRKEIRTTHLTSTAETSYGGLNKGGAPSFLVLWDKAIYTTLKAAYDAATPALREKFFRTTYFDGSKVEYKAWVSDLPDLDNPDDDEATYTFTEQKTGGTTYTAAA